jgi:DNA-binding beta-propeller fold protein YncE
VVGTGTAGPGPWQLNSPSEVFVDDDRAVYIADTNNHRIQKWTYGACSGVTVAGTGTPGAAASQLNSPLAVIVDSNQYMYITDLLNHRIQRWAPGACAGECLVGCSGSGGSGSYQLYYPRSMAFDNQGALYVSDGGNHRVQKFVLVSAIGK